MKNKIPKRGFTLVELLVVVSIISLLSSIVLSGLSVARSKARDTKAIAEIKSIQQALELYRATTGSFPATANNTIAVTGAWPGSSLSMTSLTSFFSATLIPTHIPSITGPATSFYAYVNNQTNSVGTCGGVTSTNFPYVLFFNTENTQSGFATASINGAPNNSPRYYCITLR
jgi:prepilin-type N-terminal cleavage/methylation domain-containing protein